MTKIEAAGKMYGVFLNHRQDGKVEITTDGIKALEQIYKNIPSFQAADAFEIFKCMLDESAIPYNLKQFAY